MSKIFIKPKQVHSVLSNTMLVKGYPIVCDLKKCHNSFIHDSVTSKDFLDMFSFYGSWPIAHNHPKLNNDHFKNEIGEIAIHNPSNADIYTVEMAKFVSTFQRVCMPNDFKHLFLISTGAHAVENALKTAFDWKTRKNIAQGKSATNSCNVIHFKKAFHGRSGYTLQITNTDPLKYLHFPLFNWPRFELPVITFPFNIQNLIQKEQEILYAIETELSVNGSNTACIILEPIQGEGGDNHFRPEFWQSLRQLANLYNVMLIADEVQSGMGLTGKMWAYEHLGATPDIICFGKKAQVCGIICTNKVDEVQDNVFVLPSRINSTWGGNLVDMVRSTRMLEIIEEEKLLDNAAQIGQYALNLLHQLAAKHPTLISNVRGRGLMCAFDLPNEQMCNKLKQDAYDRQLLIISCGAQSIRLRPMLDVKKEEIDQCIQIIDSCLTEKF